MVSTNLALMKFWVMPFKGEEISCRGAALPGLEKSTCDESKENQKNIKKIKSDAWKKFSSVSV